MISLEKTYFFVNNMGKSRLYYYKKLKVLIYFELIEEDVKLKKIIPN